MYKIAMIGDRESVQGFLAIGFSVVEVNSIDEARAALRRLVKEGDCAVIFLVEHYAVELEDEMARYKNLPIPAISVIPGSRGGNGYGIRSIRAAMERAVGADILFRDDAK